MIDLGTNTVNSFSIDPTFGNLTFVSGKPTGMEGEGVAVDPTGRFVYVAASGIYAYTISNTGVLTPTSASPFTEGGFPNAVVVDPSGRFLYAANNRTFDVSAFVIDPNTGNLTTINGSFPAGSFPRAMTLDASGSFAYVANSADNDLSAYTIDPASGALTPNPAAPFLAGRNVYWVTTTSNIH
jgi:6-phosphogluconolactonase (cycloisomerase 2 family)